MGEKRNFSKLEEALEIKSLRRIISAYLNYSDAAEEDVRRYERSYKKLSPTHKALLSHLPSKYNKLRRCISMNTYFIMNMLQAFEPPIDMSQDIDIDEHENLENSHNGHLQTKVTQDFQDGSICTVQGIPINGSEASEPESSSLQGRSNVACDSFRSINEKEKQELYVGNSCKSTLSKDMLSACHSDSCNGCGDAGKINSPSHDWLDPSLQRNVPLVDVDKVRCIIRNIVRDWAPEGQKERDQCYKPILEELNRLFPVGSKERPPCCLVPGAGLGRLALEISCLGFVTQGNEFSYYMMICSSFILNHTDIAGEWTIYPWIHSNCNALSDNDQLRPVSFPDIHPASNQSLLIPKDLHEIVGNDAIFCAGITEGFSMCGGDFVEVYSDECQEASWDVVVTCFFLDTAHNIVEYIEIISKIIKDGGIWINLGPLLYHFADAYGQEDEMSIELSLEDVKQIAFHYGFELEMEKIIETTYTANPRAMMQNRYFAAFWTMKRKLRA